MSKEKEIAEEYASSLADLTVNSKPLINMLTILAEENVEHAGVIVDTVEKHLEKVHPDVKLPVLYLVDSIIKNVGGAYTQKFAQSIVNMFTRTFKQVDEKIRSQMFKLRETWHDVFPATKLYQLDVKVNLIDPAWPIQAQPQPHQANIHKIPTTSGTPALTAEEEKMRSILAKKEQELLMLQQKKIEMQLEKTRRQLEMAEKNAKKTTAAVIPTSVPAVGAATGIPSALVSPVTAVPVMPVVPEIATLSAKARLGPPVNKPSSGRIAPVSAALAAARRDPRLARQQASAPALSTSHPPIPVSVPHVIPTNVVPAMPHIPPTPIAPNVFDIKPLERATKRKNVITYEVQPDNLAPRQRRDPRIDKRDRNDERRKEKIRLRDERRKLEQERREGFDKKEQEHKAEETKTNDKDKNSIDKYIDKIPDVKKINKLPPIPKINRDENKDKDTPSPVKRKKEVRPELKKKKDESAKDESSSGSSPEKKPSKLKAKEAKVKRAKEKRVPEEVPAEPENQEGPVAFKELKNYHKERYMRRNKEKSESPPPVAMEQDSPVKQSANMPEVCDSKDVDLRVLPSMQEPKPAAVGGKRPSTETAEGKPKKNKLDKFDILFGNEDVDLRQLPHVEETPPVSKISSPTAAPINASPKSPTSDLNEEERSIEGSPKSSPKKDWHEVKEKDGHDVKKAPSKLDLVRAKLAEATKGKDRLGRPLLFSKSPSEERERRRTISSEDTDLRADNSEVFDAEDHKKTISIIMNQAKEQYTDGQLDKNQYNTLMYQVLQLNEKLKLKEAKQRESLELSKQKLKAARIQNQNNKVSSPSSSPNSKNNFGDIDERITPAFVDPTAENKSFGQDSDMRKIERDMEGIRPVLLPAPPMMPMFLPGMPVPFGPGWRGPRPRVDEYVPRRFRPPIQPPFYRGKFDKRLRAPFERLPLPLPTPKIGMCQGENPLKPYDPIEPPTPLGAPGVLIPPTDPKIIEYIDQDPVKTIQIDGIPREIRYYGETAIIMLDWDDPREIKFLPGCRRVTFDNKDSVVLSFNEPYKQVEIDDQVFDIKFGSPTRELFINGRWWESFFGGQPFGVIIDGKPRLVHLEGPLPQVDIGKTKRTDLVAGKVNLIVNATQMCPVYLDAKVQKFMVNGQYYTIRFVDALKTVLINEQPFKVEFGDLPKPITLGNEKFFVRFSALPRNVKPGQVQIANMEGVTSLPLAPALLPLPVPPAAPMEVDEEVPVPPKTPSPELEHKGLDMLASVMPSNTDEAPPSATEYSSAEPLFTKPDTIPGLEAPQEENPEKPVTLPMLGNINVTDLFAKLLATGIVQMPQEKKEKDDAEKQEDEQEDKTKIHRVDLLKSETLRVKQPGIVAKLYGGMQCSGCGARFPPEHTVRYSQHLDWHFRQNRRERDSARRAHSRHWHYDLSDWVQYEEVEDLEEREKSWFETGGAGGEAEGSTETGNEAPGETPSVAAGAPQDQECALCGDKFDQFYNEDKEEWHLRNSVRHEEQNYHPMCFEDYKASLTKEEPPKEESEEIVSVEKEEDEPISIIDADETGSQDDVTERGAEEGDDDVVEVVEAPEKLPEEPPVEIDEGDEDDVVLKAEPIEQVEVDDDVDTDDETSAERRERDRQAEIDFSKVKIKQEPIDPDDEPIITSEEESVPTSVECTLTSHTTVQSTIDGNVKLASAPQPPPAIVGGGIRINISKSMPAANSFTNNISVLDSGITGAQVPPSMDDISTDDEPLPPGEEPELIYKLKPHLEGIQFSRQPPVNKGNELSGLCSIM